jgi:hypothetical protein
MEKIVCNGVHAGREETISCKREPGEAWDITVNGKHDERVSKLLMQICKWKYPFAAIYFPEDEDSAFYMMAALERYYDKYPDFQIVDVEDEMPGAEGVIY